MKKRVLALALILAMTVVPSVAYGEAAQDTAASAASEAGEAEEAKETVGEKKTDGDYALELKNATGMDIRGISIVIDSAEPEELALSGDGVFKADEERTLYCTPKTKNADGSDVSTPPVYDLLLTFDEDKVMTLHTLPFGDAESVEIRYEDPVAYVVFTSLSQKQEYNTQLSEKVKNGFMTSEEAYGKTETYYYDDEDDYDDYDYDDYDDGGSEGNACLDDAILY